MAASNSKRIEWIDCAKGIAIILVIVGHTVTNDKVLIHQVIRGGIFSFHMPLFFILSCVTYRFSETRDQFVTKTERAFRHLIIPLIGVYALITVIDAAKNCRSIQAAPFVADRINELIYASGADVRVGDATVPAIGMLWFLAALFAARQMYDYLHLCYEGDCTKCLVATCLMAIGGILISRVQWLPFSFDIVLAIMPFMWFGDKMKSFDAANMKNIFGISATILWAVLLIATYKHTHTYIELTVRRYPLGPISYITAISGTIMVVWISNMTINSIGSHGMGLTWLGEHSMYLYLIHKIDTEFPGLWNVGNSIIIASIIRITLDISFCIVVVWVVKRIRIITAEKKNHGE